MATVKQNNLQYLLTADDKRIGRAGDVLCHLFRDVLLSRGMTLYTWKNVLYPKYMDGSDPTRDPRRDRGNLNNQLAGDYFTWTNFKRAIEFLRPEYANFMVTIRFPDEEVGHTYTLRLAPKESEEDDVLIIDQELECEIVFDAKRLKDSSLNKLLFGMICDIGISKKRWGKLLDEYVDVTFPVEGENKKSRQRRRNTIDSDLRRKKVSWSIFRKALSFLQVEDVSFVLEMKWPKEKYPTLHQLTGLPVDARSK